MITVCAWCPADAPPMHDDERPGDLINHGICQPHLFAMRAKLSEEPPHVDDVSARHDSVEEPARD